MKKIIYYIDLFPIFFFNVITLSRFDKNIFFSIGKLWFVFWECRVWIHLDNKKSDGTAYSKISNGEPLCISLRHDLEKEKLWTVMLHEVGHLKDSSILKEKYWKNRYSLKQNKAREKTAWKYALKFSKKYNIPIKLDYAINCLQTYDTKSVFLIKAFNHQLI